MRAGRLPALAGRWKHAPSLKQSLTFTARVVKIYSCVRHTNLDWTQQPNKRRHCKALSMLAVGRIIKLFRPESKRGKNARNLFLDTIRATSWPGGKKKIPLLKTPILNAFKMLHWGLTLPFALSFAGLKRVKLLGIHDLEVLIVMTVSHFRKAASLSWETGSGCPR